MIISYDDTEKAVIMRAKHYVHAFLAVSHINISENTMVISLIHRSKTGECITKEYELHSKEDIANVGNDPSQDLFDYQLTEVRCYLIRDSHKLFLMAFYSLYAGKHDETRRVMFSKAVDELYSPNEAILIASAKYWAKKYVAYHSGSMWNVALYFAQDPECKSRVIVNQWADNNENQIDEIGIRRSVKYQYPKWHLIKIECYGANDLQHTVFNINDINRDYDAISEVASS